MANSENKRVSITVQSESEIQEIDTMRPIGKENVAKCIKSIGQYIIDNADKIVENIDKTIEININGNISVNNFPTVEIVYTNQIIDTSMIKPDSEG